MGVVKFVVCGDGIRFGEDVLYGVGMGVVGWYCYVEWVLGGKFVVLWLGIVLVWVCY